MAQAGFSTIQLYYSTTNTTVPVAGNLLPGELGFNINSADFSLYAENSAGTVTRLMNNPAGLKYPTADGTVAQVLTTNGSGILSFTSAATGDVTLNGVQVLTNKTIAYASNTLTGVQPTLVSGTSIKTINSTSLLGAGDIAIGGGGLTLLATVTPTATANIDFLTTFSASYDNYLIVGSGITLGTTDGISMRLAVTGTADSGSNYVTIPVVDVNGSTTSTSLVVTSSANVNSGGKGCNFQISILNANDTGRFKGIDQSAVWNDNTGTSYVYTKRFSAYVAGNAVTGIRFFATGGANFAATGKVRIYGYSNT